MTIRNRELSQFGSFVYVEDSTQKVGIATDTLPYVGIGTTNPEYKLHVIGDVKIDGNFYYDGQLSFGNIDLNTTGIITATAFYDPNGNLLSKFDSWLPSNFDIYRSVGNVGIGTSIPSQKLDVNGNVSASQFISTVSAGTPPFQVTSSTQVANLNVSYLAGGQAGGTNNNDIVTIGGSQTLNSKKFSGSGVGFNGSTSGTTTLKAAATAGNNTLTLPTTTGNLICSGDTGTVTSSMISSLDITNSDVANSAAIAYSKLNLSNSITNTDISASANIAVSKLASSTISGVTLGNNLNNLTAGTYVSFDSGTTYNGNLPKTITIKASSLNDPTNYPIVARDSSGNFTAGNVSVSNLTSNQNVVFNGSTSGTTTLKAAATAGNNTLTLPTTTGNLICSGDTGAVTSGMILNGTILNEDISTSANIAITKLSAFTISGVSLGNNLNNLTAGTYVSFDSGTTYNGNLPKTITIKASSLNDPTNYPIVARDSSGSINISGVNASGIVTATSFRGDGSQLTGIVAGSSVSDETSSSSTFYPILTQQTTGTLTSSKVSTFKLSFTPSTGNLFATQFTSLSDASKKTNIRPIENPIELTKQLSGIRFNWIDSNRESIGMIAQEVEKVLPELVESSEDGTKSVNYGNIVAVLIEAIKEQQLRIEELEKR